MTNPPPSPIRLSGGAKIAVDYVPLGIFMLAYFMGGEIVSLIGKFTGNEWCLRESAEMYLAVTAFMPAFAIAFAYSAWKEKRLAPMLLVSGVIIGILGTLTLVLHNKTFFYMKPTIVYALFGGLLYFGLATGRNFMRTVFDGALHLTDPAWRTLTIRYATFFLVLAVANEIAWRWLTRDCPAESAAIASDAGFWNSFLRECGGVEVAKCAGEANWVKLKVFGFTLASLIFTGFQAPLISKNILEEESDSEKSTDKTGDKSEENSGDNQP